MTTRENLPKEPVIPHLGTEDRSAMRIPSAIADPNPATPPAHKSAPEPDPVGELPVDAVSALPRDAAPQPNSTAATDTFVGRSPSVRRTLTGIFWMLLLGSVVAAVWHIQLDLTKLGAVPGESVNYVRQMFLPPNWALVPQAISAMIASIQMAWVGTVIAAILSLPLSFLAAANLVPTWVRLPVRFLFNVIRAVPELVLAVLLLTITGLTPWTGALAIGIHSVGTLGKLGAEAIEDAPRGPLEAAEAVGATWIQRVRVALWPSVSPQVLSVWLYRFEVNVRASAVLGLIGAGGIGALINDHIGFRNFPEIGTILIVLVIGTVLVDLASGTVRNKLVTGRWPWENKAKREHKANLKRTAKDAKADAQTTAV